MAACNVRVVMMRLRLTNTWLTRSFLNCGKSRLFSAVADGVAEPDPARKPKAAFFLYVAEQQKAQGVPEFPTVTERSKYFSEQWKQLTREEKEKYKAVAAEAQAQYQLDRRKDELSHPERAALQKEVKRVRLFKLRTKELEQERVAKQMPRKPPNSFGLFVGDYGKSGRRGDASYLEFLSGASQQWKQLAAEEKQKYVDEAARLRARYSSDVESWSQRMEAEGKTYLIPGHEPVMNLRRRSPFAQVMIKAIEAATGDRLDRKTVRAVLAFIAEQLTTVKTDEHIDVMQVIQLWTYTWIRLTPEQKKRYTVDTASSRATVTKTEEHVDKADSKEEEEFADTGAEKQVAKKEADASTGSASAAKSRSSSRTRSAANTPNVSSDTRQPATGGTAAESGAAEATDGQQKSTAQKKKKRPADASTTSTDSD